MSTIQKGQIIVAAMLALVCAVAIGAMAADGDTGDSGYSTITIEAAYGESVTSDTLDIEAVKAPITTHPQYTKYSIEKIPNGTVVTLGGNTIKIGSDTVVYTAPEHFTFEYLYARSASGDYYADAVTVSEDLSIRAQLKSDEYTVTFDANGGTGEMEAEVFAYSNYKMKLTANAFTRDGYIFCGWSESPDATEAVYKDGESIMPTSDMTLYAVWKYNGPGGWYVVNFYYSTEWGSRLIDTQLVKDGESATKLVDPSDTWQYRYYKDSDCTTSYSFGPVRANTDVYVDEVEVDDGSTLYAAILLAVLIIGIVLTALSYFFGWYLAAAGIVMVIASIVTFYVLIF